MAYIHGEVCWSEGRESLEAHVDAMLGALPGCAPTVPVVHSSAQFSCALATQFPHHYASDPDSQPRETNGHVGVAVDLRIHDTASIRTALRISTPEYRGLSTSDVVRLLYREYGSGGFDDLVAEGTLALWDGRRGVLVLWRDVAGTRPLYYHHRPGQRLVFSSDLRAIAKHPRVPAAMDLSLARTALETGQFHHPVRTLRKDVIKLEAGHVLVADRHQCVVRRYWQPNQLDERPHADPLQYVEELRDLLQRVISDRTCGTPSRVACHLTGGLDSSTISVLTQRALSGKGETLRGISWAPPTELVPPIPNDERPMPTAVAAAAGIDLHFTVLTAQEWVTVASLNQSLTPSTTLLWERAASSAAADAGITTILSGWGGDEVVAFNGRGFFADLARRGRWLHLTRELRLQREVTAIPVLGAVRGSVIMPILSDRALRMLKPQYVATRTLPAALHPDFAAALRDVNPVEQLDLRTRPGVRRMQMTLLSSSHIAYRAESWAAHGAELGITYSYPLLDRRVLEFALSVPDQLYFRNGWKRWMFREAAAGILPEEVRWNPNKVDASAAAGLRSITSEFWRLFEDALDDRRSNPYVDVDAAVGPRPATEEDASWLAFLDLPVS